MLKHRTLNEQLLADRKARGWSLVEMAEAWLKTMPANSKGRSKRGLVGRFNRIELGRMENGPSLPERWLFAEVFYPGDAEAHRFYGELRYVSIQETEKKFMPGLLEHLDQVKEASRVYGDYPAAPLAARSSSALANWFLLLVRKQAEFRLFAPAHAMSDFRGRVTLTCLRLLCLIARHWKDVRPTTFAECHAEVAKGDIQALQQLLTNECQDFDIFADEGHYTLNRCVAKDLLDRTVVRERQLPEHRFNPVRWFLGKDNKDAPLGLGTVGEEVLIPSQACLPALVEYVDRLLGEDGEWKPVTVDEVLYLANARGIKLELA